MTPVLFGSTAAPWAAGTRDTPVFRTVTHSAVKAFLNTDQGQPFKFNWKQYNSPSAILGHWFITYITQITNIPFLAEYLSPAHDSEESHPEQQRCRHPHPHCARAHAAALLPSLPAKFSSCPARQESQLHYTCPWLTSLAGT